MAAVAEDLALVQFPQVAAVIGAGNGYRVADLINLLNRAHYPFRNGGFVLEVYGNGGLNRVVRHGIRG